MLTSTTISKFEDPSMKMINLHYLNFPLPGVKRERRTISYRVSDKIRRNISKGLIKRRVCFLYIGERHQGKNGEKTGMQLFLFFQFIWF